MDTFQVMLSVVVLALLLMSVGYAQRDTRWGVPVLVLGIICVLSTLAYKLYITFY